MVKFGLYNKGGEGPLQEYEGEYLELNPQGETVCVMANDGSGGSKMVAAIRLGESQSVKKI